MSSIQALLCILVVNIPQCFGETYLDLSFSLHEDSAYWPNGLAFNREETFKGHTIQGYWYESYNLCMSEHTSTHLDAPSHFSKDKWTVDQIPLSHLMGPGVVIDIQKKVEKDPLAELTTDDIMEWIDEYGELPDGVIIFVRTGWGSRYGNKTAYFGTATNDTNNLIFPGISLGAAQLLTGYAAATGRRVVGVGLDTPSLDNGASTDYPTHVEILSANIYGIENVANLEKLPTTDFHVTIMPLKIRGGSGAPARILASLPSKSTATQITMQVFLVYFMTAIFTLLSGCLWSF